MTRRRSSPLGLELVASVVLALVALPLLSHGAPVQEAHADLQKYSEGCYYNYNHYSEGDRILTNEPCLNCTCHNRMLMCYLRVCPFTKPIGHDCTIEKREDQCCPIITCPEVPVDVSHHSHELTTHAPGTELSIPEKYGCSIDSKFYPEGAQVPSNLNKPCELCYCIRNRTSCLMQECTLHIDGCQPIYNKGSCCPVRYSCDHENELLELEDFSTTTTTARPTPGYILTSTSPSISTDCLHNGEVYADGASIISKNACEHCYCMRGDIVCAVQECEMPTLESGAKTCHALPPNPGECCPSNYVCDDSFTETPLIEEMLSTLSPKVQSDLHGSVSQEDVQLQEHIDDKIAASEDLDKTEEHPNSNEDVTPVETTIAPLLSESAETDVKGQKQTPEINIEESPLATTMLSTKKTSITPTQSPIEISTPQKTETEIDDTHTIADQDKKDDSLEHDIVTEHKEMDIAKDVTKNATAIEDKPIPSKNGTTLSSESSEEVDEEKDVTTIRSPIESIESDITPEVPSLGDILSSTDLSAISGEEEEESFSEIAKPSEEEQSLGQTSIYDKIDENIVGPSISSTTVSPVYEMVTQGEDRDVELPEIADHKTDSIDDVNEPIDEVPGVEVPTTDGVKKEELPAFVIDGTTITSITKPSSIAPETPDADSTESEETSSEAEDLGTSAIIKPSIPTKDAQSEESPKDVPKPVKSEDEIPAIVQEITKPDSKDSTYQSTELPTEISDEVTISSQDSQDKQTSVEESDEQSTEPITDVQKEDGVPVLTEKDEFAISPANILAEEENVKDKPQQVITDSTTIASLSDNGASTAEKEEDKTKGQSEKNLDDSTTLSPSGSESQTPITDEEEIKKQHEENTNDVTTMAGYEIPTTEEEYALKQESAKEDKGQPEQGIAESSTVTSSVFSFEEPSTEQNIKAQPNQEFIDSTTIAASVNDSDNQEIADPSTVASAASDTVRPSADEKIKGRPDEEVVDSSTVSGFEGQSAEQEIKGRPEDGVEGSSTITPPVVEYEETVEGVNKSQPDKTDSTTFIPLIIDSNGPTADDKDLKQKPEQDITGSATAVPSVALSEETTEDVHTKDKPEPDSTIAPSLGDSEIATITEEDLKQKPEKHIVDSTATILTNIISEEIVENDQAKEKPEEDFISSTVVPSLSNTEIPSAEAEGTKAQPEQDTTDSPIPTISVIDSEDTTKDKQVKENPEQKLTDTTTILPSVSLSDIQHAIEGEIKGQELSDTFDSITDTPSATDSELTLEEEEEEVKGKPEQDIDSTTIPSPISDFGLQDETHTTDSDKESEPEDIHRPTIPPTIDENESEIVHGAEGSGDQMQEIIPSAIPGEGDCLYNNKTYAHNSEVPATSECETACSCASSVVVCQRVLCYEPPQPDNCVLDEASTDRCCPQYICGADSFVDGQRPTPSEDIEEEEIEYTPLQPMTSAPAIIGLEPGKPVQHEVALENTTKKAEKKEEPTEATQEQESNEATIAPQAPINEDELTKTEQSILSEISTPSPVDIELVAMTSEQPMSHVKNDEVQELLSAEGSGEGDISTERPQVSDEAVQPLPSVTPKPVQQINGDIKEAMQIDSNLNAPAKKPSTSEENTTLTANDNEYKESATIQPSVPGVSATDESVTVDTHTETIKPISTETPDIIGSSKIDENIFDAESGSTTIKPVEVEMLSVAPSLSSVLDLEGIDSTESAELPETEDQSSNELGDEMTGSEEETKLPVVHEEEVQKTTTAAPFAEEQSTINTVHTELEGEIKPASESATIITEYDYQKPEMPEDLSHTKFEEEIPLETATKKSSTSGAPQGSKESDESTERIPEILRPSETPVSTIHKPGEPTDLHGHVIESRPEVFDKKDEFPATDGITPTYEKPLDQSAVQAPIDEKKPLSSVSTTPTSEEFSTAPVPVDKSEVEKEEQAIAGTIAPIFEDFTQTSSPIADEQLIAETEASEEAESEENKDETPSQTSGPAIEVSGEESDEDKDAINQTSTPTFAEKPTAGAVSPISEEESDEDKEITSQTNVPSAQEIASAKPVSPISGEESNEDDTIVGQINGLPLEEKPIEGTVSPTSGEESNEDKEITSQTSMPTAEEKPTVGLIFAISGEESDENPGILSQTSIPIVESKPVAEQVAPASEEEANINQEIMIQTSVPTLEAKPTAGPVITISTAESDEDEETHIKQPISETIVPISGDVSHTIAPIVDEQPISDTTTPISIGHFVEEKDETSSQTSVPITGTIAAGSTDISEEDKKNDLTVQTRAPVAKEESITETTTPIIANTSQEEKDEITSQTDIPTDKGQPFAGTTASISADESKDKKDENASQLNISSTEKEPTAQDETNKKEKQEVLSGIATSTVAPVTADKLDTSSDISEHVHDVEEDLLSPSEESIASSSATAPAKQDEETISETAKPITSVEYPGQDKEKEPSVPPSVLITETEGEDVLPTGKHDELTPSEVQRDTILEAIDSTSNKIVETIASTGAPVKSESEEQADSNATETPLSIPTEAPVKSESEEEAYAYITETPLPIPTKSVEAEDTVEEESESDKSPPEVEIALSSTQSPDIAVEKDDSTLPEQISTTVPTSSESDQEKEDFDEIPESTSVDVDPIPSKADRGSEEKPDSDILTEVSVSTTQKPVSADTENIDKTLLQTGVPEIGNEFIQPVDQDHVISGDIAGSPSELPSATTDSSVSSATQKPVLGDKENVDKTVLQTEFSETANEFIHPVDQDHIISGQFGGSASELPSASTDSSVSSATQKPVLGDKDNIDKTLLQTEVPETTNESIHPVDQDNIIFGEIAGSSSEQPSAATDNSVTSEEASSTGTKKPIIDNVPIPELIVIDEVTAQPGKPDSDDQVAVDEISSETAKPAVDNEIAAATESSTDLKKPSTQHSLLEKEKTTLINQSKDGEIESFTKKPVSTEKELEQDPLEKQPTTEQTVTKTEATTAATSVAQKEDKILDSTDQLEHTANEVLTQTEQPIAFNGPALSISHDPDTVKDTTDKPSEESSIFESEDDNKETTSTSAPVNLSDSTIREPDDSVDSESTTTFSEESEEENEQTVPPKNDVKIQTVAEFVTERVDDLTTALPAIDTNKDEVSKPSVPTLTEEMSTSSSEEEDKEEEVPQLAVTTEKATISTVAGSDEKEPEMPPKLSEIDLKLEERPTVGAIPSSTSEKPLVSVENKLDAEPSKPIATDKATADQEQEETPVNTTYHPLFSNIELDRTTVAPISNVSDKIDDQIHISESTAKPTYTSTSTIAPTTEEITTQKSVTNAPTSHYQPPGYGPVPPQYPSYTEDEYTDEDETEVFGPGTCRYGGKLFVSAQQIPRDDPCDFCFCFRSDIICLQQSCPPPISGCHEEPISGFCCPRYECPVSMATVLNITTSTTTTSTTLPPHFLHHAYRGAAEKNGCHINGKSYRVGDKIDSASGPCMHCTCGGDGQMKCDPKTCSPEPMLRQMIAVVASRRR